MYEVIENIWHEPLLKGSLSHDTYIYWNNPEMMMMIRVQIPWGKIRTRGKGERDGKKEIQEGCYGVTTTNQTGWKGGAVVYVWSHLWGSPFHDCSARGNLPSTSHPCVTAGGRAPQRETEQALLPEAQPQQVASQEGLPTATFQAKGHTSITINVPSKRRALLETRNKWNTKVCDD